MSVFSLNIFAPVAKLKRDTWPEEVAKMQRPEPTMSTETRWSGRQSFFECFSRALGFGCGWPANDCSKVGLWGTQLANSSNSPNLGALSLVLLLSLDGLPSRPEPAWAAALVWFLYSFSLCWTLFGRFVLLCCFCLTCTYASSHFLASFLSVRWKLESEEFRSMSSSVMDSSYSSSESSMSKEWSSPQSKSSSSSSLSRYTKVSAHSPPWSTTKMPLKLSLVDFEIAKVGSLQLEWSTFSLATWEDFGSQKWKLPWFCAQRMNECVCEVEAFLFRPAGSWMNSRWLMLLLYSKSGSTSACLSSFPLFVMPPLRRCVLLKD